MLFQSTRPVRGATARLSPPVICTATRFNPRAPCGARRFRRAGGSLGKAVSIHAPRAGRDSSSTSNRHTSRRFNPRAPCGARRDALSSPSSIPCFNPRAPCGARPALRYSMARSIAFQSTRPVRGATLLYIRDTASNRVSIHAPRAGRDLKAGKRHGPASCFNPRAPCGARPSQRTTNGSGREFQSTRPVRGATLRLEVLASVSPCFNPRAPCGARLSDSFSVRYPGGFQSTRPVRGATARAMGFCEPGIVSIHAPRAGRDPACASSALFVLCFNPRAPCGARRDCSAAQYGSDMFQSTRPVRGATPYPFYFAGLCRGFNPRAPCGARQCLCNLLHINMSG